MESPEEFAVALNAANDYAGELAAVMGAIDRGSKPSGWTKSDWHDL